VNGSHGNDANDGLSWKTAKLTIANATGTVSDGGTVSIANGVYRGSGNTNIIINKSMTITGQSKSGTIINGDNSAQIFKIQKYPREESMPNLNIVIQNLTITNGNPVGTRGTISTDNVCEDTLTIKDCIFKYNNEAIYCNMGSCAVTGCIFINNTRAISNTATLIITGCTFINNTAYSGGAIATSGTCTITGSVFTGNKATGDTGGAIRNIGILNVFNSAFTYNSAAYNGGAIYSKGNLTANFNQIAENTCRMGGSIVCNTGGTTNAELNWWGNNNKPTGIGGFTINKWFVLKVNTNSSSVPINTNSKITADLRYDNYGTLHTESYLPNGIPVAFTTNLGTVSAKAYTVNGIAQSTLKSALGGTANVSAIVNSQQVSKLVKIIDKVPPKVSSTYPKNLATGCSRTSTIYLKFNENIKAGTYWSKIYVKNMKTGKTAIISKSIKGNTLYIKMSSKRYAYTWYQIYIPKAAVKDSFNNNLAASYTFKFKTGKYPLDYQ
jgi:predicted outer membrane repeat protein